MIIHDKEDSKNSGQVLSLSIHHQNAPLQRWITAPRDCRLHDGLPTPELPFYQQDRYLTASFMRHVPLSYVSVATGVKETYCPLNGSTLSGWAGYRERSESSRWLVRCAAQRQTLDRHAFCPFSFHRAHQMPHCLPAAFCYHKSHTGKSSSTRCH